MSDPTRKVVIQERDVADLRAVLLRGIGEYNAELKRLRTLGSAYWDRPAGEGASPLIEQVEKRISVVEFILAQLEKA